MALSLPARGFLCRKFLSCRKSLSRKSVRG